MPNFYAPYQQPYYQPVVNQPVQQQTVQQPQIQNGGFVSVRSETEARNYPIAPGNSVTFKDETAPYVYTKTMGFSQLDRPIFEKYKLVKEDVADSGTTENFNSTDELKNEVNELKDELNELKGEIDAIKTQVNEQTHTTTRKTKSETKSGGDD